MIGLAPLWYITCALISLSLVYSAASIYSIIRRLGESVWLDPEPDPDPLRIAIILPFYNERAEDVEETFLSIARQDFPRDRLKVFVVVEESDSETLNHVLKAKAILEHSSVPHAIYVKKGDRKGKAVAMNFVFPYTRGFDVIVVYDAGDRVEDPYHLRKVSTLIRRCYVAIGCKVYRVSEGVLGFLSYLDTLLWYNVALPGITKLVGYPFLSGEGLAISRSFLERIGGFPEKLAEDSYITIYLAIYGEKAALLNVVIREGAPRTLISLIKQRVRWYRGDLQCLKDLLIMHRPKIRPKVFLRLILGYMQCLSLITIPAAVLCLILSVFVPPPLPVFIVTVLSIVAVCLAPLYAVLNFGIRNYALLLAPLHWLVQGLVVVLSIVMPRVKWFKTVRNSVYASSYLVSTS